MKKKYIFIAMVFLAFIALSKSSYAAILNVATEQQLYSAGLSPEYETIKLTDDIVVESSYYPQCFSIQEVDRTLDLNGHTLTINEDAKINFYNSDRNFTIKDTVGTGKIVCNDTLANIYNDLDNNTITLNCIKIDLYNRGTYIFGSGSVENPKKVKVIVDGVVMNTKTSPFGAATDLLIKHLVVFPIQGGDTYIGFYNDGNINRVSDIVDPDSTIINCGEIFTQVRNKVWARDIYYTASKDGAYLEIRPANGFVDPVTVTFVLEDEPNNVVRVERGVVVNNPCYSDNYGREAIKWYTDPGLTNEFSFSTRINNDIILYPLLASFYELRSYDLTNSQTYDGGKIKLGDSEQYSFSGRINKGNSITVTAIPNEGYKFVEWRKVNDGLKFSEDSTLVLNSEMGNLELFAVFEEDLEAQGKRIITFETNGGSAIEKQKVNVGEKAIKPDNPTKENAIFENWYADSDFNIDYYFNLPVTENITLYGRYCTWVTGAAYDLTTNSKYVGGKYTLGDFEEVVGANYTLYSDEEYELTAIPNEGYRFVEWRMQKETYSAEYDQTETYSTNETINVTFDEHASFYAVFEKIPEPITQVNVTLQAPRVGDSITLQEIADPEYGNYMQPNKLPLVSCEDDAKYEVTWCAWIRGTYPEIGEDFDDLFEGEFKADTYYYAEIEISTKHGYVLDDELVIKVNGEEPAEVFGIFEGENTHFIAKIKSTEGENVIKGDLNNDGFINSTDSAIVLDLYKNSNATDIQIKVGDMNNDNYINSADAAMILDCYKNGTIEYIII